MICRQTGKRKKGVFVPAIALALVLPVLFAPSAARAQCENSFTATSTFNQMAQDIADDLNDFIEQEENFIEDKITNTAKNEVITRLEEFDQNIREGLSVWWREHFEPALKEMTTQLHASQIDQSRAYGSMMDAQNQNEYMQDLQKREVEAVRRYQPNEMSCQLDSVALGDISSGSSSGGVGKAARMARASARALANQSQPERQNAQGTAAGISTSAEQNERWEEYIARFCDPDKGGQGCDGAPGDLAGRHVDLPALLWGDRQTIDATSADNQFVVDSVLKYMLAPKSLPPVPEQVVQSPVGQQTLLRRRTLTARQNTIYNSVALMIGQRLSGSNVNTQEMRTASGLPAADASTDASYAEIVHAVSKDRFHNPQYIVRLIESPEQVIREQGTVNAVRLQQMNELYKRMEEMVFMEVAAHASAMDINIPKPDAKVRPTNQ
ncbi:MAG: hypothetical protein H3C49_03425 [Alphaproteobacteria bacterium]|nr:hypothetical protein [Alphaproteobacteria bacterium]